MKKLTIFGILLLLLCSLTSALTLDATVSDNLYNYTPTTSLSLNNISLGDGFYINGVEYCESEYVESFTTTRVCTKPLQINIYDFETSSLISQLVTITSIREGLSYYNSTSNGTITIDVDFLTPTEYELRFESVNYTSRSIYLTVNNESTKSIDIYMTSNSTAEIQTIEVVDTSNAVVEGAIVWLQQEQLNSTTQWITIQEALTNNEGKTAVYVDRSTSVYYRFAVIVDGEAKPIEPNNNLFTSKTIFIPGITETIQIKINLQEDTETMLNERLNIQTDMYYESASNDTIYFSFIDGNNAITGGRLVIEGKYIDSNLTYQLISTEYLSGSSGILNYTFTPINNTIYTAKGYIVYSNHDELAETEVKMYNVDVIINKNTGILLAVVLLVVIALLTASYGPFIGSLFTFGSIFIITAFGLVQIPVTIVTTALAIVFIAFLRPRNQGGSY